MNSSAKCSYVFSAQWVLAGAVLLGAVSLQAQPVIQSIHNAGSNVIGSIAPQMIVSIMGQNLAASTTSFTNFPLSTSLAGATVTFNGTKAPLFYASPTQINAQVPTSVGETGLAAVIVTTAAGASSAFSVSVQSSAVGIFTQDFTGCGQISAYNVHADGSISLNTPQSSLDPLKDYGLSIYLTGLGQFPSRADGVAAPGNPLDHHQVTILLKDHALDAAYAGPAPGSVGEDQINASFEPALRTNYAQGCKVPLSLSQFPYSTSQYVNVSVRQGGGACVDPAADSFGVITWRKSSVSDGSSPTLPPSSDSVDAQFLQGPGVGFPTVATPGVQITAGPITPQASFCAASFPGSLPVGTLSATAFGSFVTLPPHINDGVVTFQAALPDGSITGGNVSVQSAGSTVGPFLVDAQIPPPVAITTSLKPGTTLTGNQLVIDWSGGDDRSEMQVQFLVRSQGQVIFSNVTTLASAASGLSTTLPGVGQTAQSVPAGDVEIILTQQPAIVPSQLFSSPGLTLGGEQAWSYVWDFKGLKHQ